MDLGVEAKSAELAPGVAPFIVGVKGCLSDPGKKPPQEEGEEAARREEEAAAA